MSKIRNSLGVLVLPVPDEEITWEEYKAKYGIDLHQVFEIDDNDLTTFKPDFSKTVLLSIPVSYDPTAGRLPTIRNIVASEISSTNGLILGFAVMIEGGNIVTRYGLHIDAMNKTVNYYEI